MQWICWGRLEVELFVENSGFLVLGVNQDCSCTDLLGRGDCSSEGIFQKRGPKSFPLLRKVYSESGMQDDRNCVAGKTPFDSLRNRLRLYACYRQGVVTDHPPSSMNDKNPG